MKIFLGALGGNDAERHAVRGQDLLVPFGIPLKRAARGPLVTVSVRGGTDRTNQTTARRQMTARR